MHADTLTNDQIEMHKSVDAVARTNAERLWLLFLIGARMNAGDKISTASGHVCGALLHARWYLGKVP